MLASDTVVCITRLIFMLKIVSVTAISALLATTPAIAKEYMGKTSDGDNLYFNGDATVFRDENGWYRFTYSLQGKQGFRERKAITGYCTKPGVTPHWITVVDGYPVIVGATSQASIRLLETVCGTPLDDHD